jgi:UDP-GlcNAc:undecaprenyl-phosphate GlcNAc-1-phosphate transferase
VLIFYAWTAVASIGVLSFLFMPWWGSLTLLLVGFVVTTIVTLSPLSKRKRSEAAAQLAETDDGQADATIARLDPLDAAAGASGDEAGILEADAALARLQKKEASS